MDPWNNDQRVGSSGIIFFLSFGRISDSHDESEIWFGPVALEHDFFLLVF
jgi:hypothetical protein